MDEISGTETAPPWFGGDQKEESGGVVEKVGFFEKYFIAAAVVEQPGIGIVVRDIFGHFGLKIFKIPYIFLKLFC